MAAAKNREGTTYRHKTSDAIVLCVKTRHLSFGTSRHTLLVLDAGNSSSRRDGEQIEVDEVPTMVWESTWEPL